MKKLFYFLPWCIFAVLLILGVREASTISKFSKISLRYQNAISGQAAYRAREYSAVNAAFWLIFWRESTATLSVGFGDVASDTILFSGDANLVWHAEYVAGYAPGAEDEAGIAVSQALANRLWGSTNIIGQAVEIDEQTRFVRGVFVGGANLALLSFPLEDVSQSWTGVELYGEQLHFGAAEAFAAASGLGRPEYILTGEVISLAWAFALLPLLVPAVYALFLVIKYMRMYHPRTLMPLFFAGLLLFAVLLPALLDALPDWVVPTRWSDFSFWSSLAEQTGDSLRVFLSAVPTMRDVELKVRLLRVVGIGFLGVCLGLVGVGFRHRPN
ncbi:MAG: hypothetical protein FWG87_03940 [Defluviitaleaceae bacterium]|nr:hypothetical protein [Defluviitaleaceae bacterium]